MSRGTGRRRNRLRWPVIVFGTAAFTVLLTLGPIFAGKDVDAGGSSERFAAGNSGMLVARQISILSASAAPDDPPEAGRAAESPFLPAPATSVPATNAPPQTTTTAPVDPPPPGDDGSIAIELAPLDPRPFEDGALTRWEMTVTNDGNRYLWAVSVYLDGRGPVHCGARQLVPGGSTTCTAGLRVWANDPTVTARATGWTTGRMVRSETSHPVVIGA